MSEAPRYRQLAATLRAQIESRALLPGMLLPTEQVLCERYGISRHTAREALRLLTEDGLIERRRGIGSVVKDGGLKAFSQNLDDFQSVLQYARDARLDVADCALADDRSLEVLGLTGKHLVYPGVRRRSDGQAVALTRIFVRVELGIGLETARELHGSFSEYIEVHYGVTVARLTQRMEAVTLKRAEAEQLDVLANSPALRTVRRYHDVHDKILLLSESLHPAGRFAYEMELKRTRLD